MKRMSSQERGERRVAANRETLLEVKGALRRTGAL